METPTLTDVMAFNDELAALVKAGVPLELGLGASPNEAAAALGRINAFMARRAARGVAAAAALEGHDPPLPTAYRSVLEFGIRSGSLQTALNGATRLGETVEDARFGTRSALAYPLVVCCLAIAGVIGFCKFCVPELTSAQAELRIPSGPGLKVAQSLRESLPVLLVILAVVVALTVWNSWRAVRPGSPGKGRGSLSRISGAAKAVYQQRCARFAEAMAALLAADVPMDEALPIAAGSSGDVRLADAARAMALALEQGRALAGDERDIDQLPPFLRWALLKSEPAVERTRALRMAAEAYHQSSKRSAERAGVVVPIIACVVLAGGATLAYGLLLFVPLVDMLRALAVQF